MLGNFRIESFASVELIKTINLKELRKLRRQTTLIFIVIDHSNYEEASVLGVFKSHSECEEFILKLPDGDCINVVTWDTIRNVEVR